MKYVFASLALLIGLVPVGSAMAADQGVEGYWLTQNERAVVHLEACEEDSLCGSIYWIIEGGLQKDIHNDDEALRDRPICGLQIMGDFEQDDPDEWEDGYIYKADDGDMYDADLELEDDGTLKLRGYVGISLLGKTQVWTRVDQKDYKPCTAPKA